MFENQLKPQSTRLTRYAAFSLTAHVLLIGAVVFLSAQRAKDADKDVAVVFRGMPVAAPPPPPPPPPPPKRHNPVTPVTKKPPVEPAKFVQPKELPKEPPKEEEPPAKEEEAAAPDEPGAEDDGVEGGVEGGAVGGVVGGLVGSSTPPPAAEPVKPKNVPPFVIARDLIRQTSPRLSEVYKQSHRGQPPARGLYKVCVGTDGRVYEVTPIQPVPGADEDIKSGIIEGWLYKPQQVPLCFLYNMAVTVQ